MTASDFYNTNKDCVWDMTPIPDNLTDVKDKAKWILSSGFAWIELNRSIELDLWKQESENCKQELVIHREYDDHRGWRSCCIHGLDVDKTGIWSKYATTEPNYNWTTLADATPVIKKFWQSLPFERYSRIRFMEVTPDGYIAPHSDLDMSTLSPAHDPFNNIVPINIAIVHPDKCFMTLKDSGLVPWVEGKVLLVNISKFHSVINFSKHSRLHMIGHGIPGNKTNEFCELVVNSYNTQYETFQARSKQ